MQYNSLNNYLKNKFGCKVYKLSINAGLTCPNRDGTISYGGCIFCSEGGSGDFSTSPLLSITEQIESAKSRVSSKIKNGKYIAYFQAFTNTYGPIDYLRKIFTEAVEHPDIVAISIATRPDCLPDEVLDLLSELNAIKPVWVELGLQTIHEKTANYINRGYSLECFENAIDNLRRIHIETIVHVIIGLPFESEEEIYETIKYVSSQNIQGIKLQLLHVLQNTALANDYNNNLFETLSMEQYIKIIARSLELIPENIVIHRFTGDGPKSLLIAPAWSCNKKNVLNSMNKYFRDNNIIQGRLTVERFY